jgi:hypothetical protein
MNVGQFRKLLESLAEWHERAGQADEALALRKIMTLFPEGSRQGLSPALNAMAKRLRSLDVLAS